jgi:large subunit ribosomal protein L15
LSALEKAVVGGKLVSGQTVDRDVLVAAGMARPNGAPIRILAKGEIKSKLNLAVHSASASAKTAIEAVGGSLAVETKMAEAGG